MAVKGLGRGLGVLLGEEAVTRQETGGIMIRIERIEPNLNQPRKEFDEQALMDLAESIKMHGMLQPIAVRRLSSGYYQIIAGERRWRAARMAGLAEVPAVVFEADDRRVMEMALIENLQREDLNAIEEALGIKALVEDYGLTQEEAAQRIGRSRPAIANALRLLSLPDQVKDMIEKGVLSGAHGRTLLSLSDSSLLIKAAEKVAAEGLSVRETENLVRKFSEQSKEKPAQKKKEPNYLLDMEKKLSDHFARKVKITNRNKKGKIELEYYDPDDLEELFMRLVGRRPPEKRK